MDKGKVCNDAVKKVFFCKNHNCSDGFTDGKGNWHCWHCYKEDAYLNPRGELIEEAQVGKYLLRALAERNHVIIELWQTDKVPTVLVGHRECDYLSQASRVYMRALHHLEKDPPIVGLE